ncbi:cystatin-2-like [Pseudophryne corroboree]|uniref:cystatin-2-like n=1 Tax=Pseudophryne corroboree TaxID=495146 RepID=UPI0030815471
MAAALCFSVVVALSVLSVSSEILVGAPERDNPSDPDVIKAAAFAVNGFNQKSSEDYIYKLVKIVSAETQVVAGVRYILNVEIGKTQCKKSESDTHSCAFIQDPKLAQTLLCTFSVLEVPWEDLESLETSSCKTQ